jgi:colicin import membrane protein
MDPTIIESHTGMKFLTNEEYTQLQTNLDKSKSEARQINAQVQLKFSKLLETTTAVEKMKKDIEELKKAIEEKEKEAADAAKPEEKETKVADAASESVLEEKETKAADASKPVIDEKEKKAAGAVKATTDEKGAANNDNAKVAETKQ